MPDVTLARVDEMETIYEGVARRARAALGVTAWGRQVMTLPPDWDGYPNHSHDASTEEAGQEEVYIPLEGSALLTADGETYELRPGVMVRGRTRAEAPDPARGRGHPLHRPRRRSRQGLRRFSVDRARRATASGITGFPRDAALLGRFGLPAVLG